MLRDVALAQARHLRVRATRRHQHPRGDLDGLRHRAAPGEERDPVHRRRHVARAPGRGAAAVQRHRRGQGVRQARHGRHAAHGAGRDRRQRFDHHRLRPIRRAPMPPATRRRSTRWASMPTAPQSPFDDPRVETITSLVKRTARHGRRRRHQHRDRGCDACGDDRAYAPARCLRPDRRAVLCRQARRADGRRLGELPAEVGAPGAQAQGRRRLHRQIPRRRLCGRDDRVRDVGGSTRPSTAKLLGLFNTGNMDGVLDRKFLKGGTREAIPRAARPDRAGAAPRSTCCRATTNGFFLMVESGLIDKYTPCARHGARGLRHHHARQRGEACADWAQTRGDDTLILVVADHTHPVSLIGTIDDDMTTIPNVPLRERVRTYDRAGFPNYPAPDKDGYPPRVDVSRRLAMFSAQLAGLLRDVPAEARRPERADRRRRRSRGTFEANERLPQRARRDAAARQPAEVSQLPACIPART